MWYMCVHYTQRQLQAPPTRLNAWQKSAWESSRFESRHPVCLEKTDRMVRFVVQQGIQWRHHSPFSATPLLLFSYTHKHRGAPIPLWLIFAPVWRKSMTGSPLPPFPPSLSHVHASLSVSPGCWNMAGSLYFASHRPVLLLLCSYTAVCLPFFSFWCSALWLSNVAAPSYVCSLPTTQCDVFSTGCLACSPLPSQHDDVPLWLYYHLFSVCFVFSLCGLPLF